MACIYDMLGHAVCRPALDEVGEVQYEMSDEDYAGKEVEDTWVQALLAHLGHYLNSLKPLLTPSNYQQLVTQLLDKVDRTSTACLMHHSLALWVSVVHS